MTSKKVKLMISIIIFSICISINLHAQLKSNYNQADYLIITPSRFVTTLQSFVNWRQNKKMNMKVVELQQIYSEFHDSTKSSSIRDFVSYSLTYWSNPKPKYILLVGSSKLLPTYKVQSIFANNDYFHEDSVSIDDWYSVNLYETNTNPDVALGRFPVNNEQELNSIISKTMYFEDSLSLEDYTTDFTFLTDKTDSSAFEEEVNRFISTTLPSSYSKKTVFARLDSSIGITKKHLFNTLNNGTMFFSYYGHGAPNRWSKYNLITFGDIDSLKENNLPFIFTAAACEQSFDPPNDSSNVRKLIVANGKGIIASICSTGLIYLFEGADFISDFYKNVFYKPGIAIGDAVLQTKLFNQRNNDSKDSGTRRYTLLGDPALKLKARIIAQIANGESNIPTSYSLQQNYPNPFNPETTIQYTIPANLPDGKAGVKGETAKVTLKVYDLLGREVATLVDEYKPTGNYKVNFNVETCRGKSLPSGIYFYRLRSGSYFETKKMILVK